MQEKNGNCHAEDLENGLRCHDSSEAETTAMTVARVSGSLYRALRAIKPLRALARWGRKQLERYRIPAWYIEGRERASAQPLTFFFAGHLESKNYILHLALEDGYVEQSAGMVWLWSAWRRGVGSGANLVVIRPERRHLWLLGSARGFNIPCWVGLEVELAAADTRFAHSSSLRTDLRNIQRHGLGFEVTRDPARFKWFYDTMYLPHVMRVHGDRSMPTPWNELECSLPQCELLFVRKGEDCIAGSVLCDMGEGRVRAWLIGVKHGDPAYAKMGAAAALYYLELQHLRRSGYKLLHYGSTRAFLHDGVLHFKKKYGPGLVGSDDCVFHLRVARGSAGVNGFLANNPFMTHESSTFYGNFFVDEAGGIDREEIRKELSRNYIRGIGEQRVYSLKDVVTPSDQGTWPPVPIGVEPASAFPDGVS